MTQANSSAGVPPLLNKTMKFVLQSPLHGMVSKYLLLFTFTGRKSGKTYTTPVSYAQKDDQVIIFTHANWWKNLQGGAPVACCVRGKELRGTAEAIAEDKQAIAAELTTHLTKSPFDAKFYDVTFDEEGNPNPEEVEEAVKTVVMIRARFA